MSSAREISLKLSKNFLDKKESKEVKPIKAERESKEIKLIKSEIESKEIKQIEYGVISHGEKQFKFLLPEEEILSIDINSLGLYLILSKLTSNKSYQRITIWDSKTDSIVNQHTEMSNGYTAARFLAGSNLILLAEKKCPGNETLLAIFKMQPFQPIKNGRIQADNFEVVSEGEQTRLVIIDKMQLYLVDPSSPRQRHLVSSIGALFPENYHGTKMQCRGIRVISGYVSWVAFHLSDPARNSERNKEFIRFAFIDVASNTISLRRCLEVPQLKDYGGNCSHERDITCLPDGKLAHVVNYCALPEIMPASPTDMMEGKQRIYIMESEKAERVTLPYTSVHSLDHADYRYEWNLFPYVLQKTTEGNSCNMINYFTKEGVEPSITLPHTYGKNSVSFLTSFNHIFYYPTQTSLHRYNFNEVVGVNYKFLEEHLAVAIDLNCHFLIPTDLCLITASYARELGMFSSKLIHESTAPKETKSVASDNKLNLRSN